MGVEVRFGFGFGFRFGFGLGPGLRVIEYLARVRSAPARRSGAVTRRSEAGATSPACNSSSNLGALAWSGLGFGFGFGFGLGFGVRVQG